MLLARYLLCAHRMGPAHRRPTSGAALLLFGLACGDATVDTQPLPRGPSREAAAPSPSPAEPPRPAPSSPHAPPTPPTPPPSTTPARPSLCELPVESGPCRAAISRYAFHSATGRCELFTYGGCQGNANNFETLEACEARCGSSSAPSTCGSSERACSSGELCDFSSDSCGAAGDRGICRARPRACTEIFAPVCGCDERTYPNLCFAHAAGVDAAFEGPCEAEPTCPDQGEDSILLGGGRSFGFCEGLCVLELDIERSETDVPEACDRVVLRARARDPAAPAARTSGRLTAEGHRAVRAAAERLVDTALQTSYGCPDCADGGAATLSLRRRGAKSAHVYPFGEAPDALAEADRLLQGILQALEGCTPSAAVEPDPGCQPLRP